MANIIFHSAYTKDQIEASIGKGPIIQDDFWYVWDIASSAYVPTGVKAIGQGEVSKAELSVALDGKQDDLGFVEDTEYPGCWYRMVGNEKEWLNPPYVPGEVYRTVERYRYNQRINTPVYAGYFTDFGALPNNTTKSVLLPTGIIHVLLSADWYLRGAVSYILPYGENISSMRFGQTVNNAAVNCTVTTTADLSANSLNVLLKWSYYG